MLKTCVLLAGGLAMIAGSALAQPDGFVDRFATIDQSLWYAANYQWNNPAFDTDWRADNAKAGGSLSLRLKPSSEGINRFVGASVRRHEPSSYGRYEVVIKPAVGSGIVSGFFLYTGEYFGALHNEIDIEFLGRDTRKINLAVFVNGTRWERLIDLGFDSAAKPRRYGIEWTKDSIRWFTGDKMLAEYTHADGPIPDLPIYLYSNIWATSAKLHGWAGKVDRQARGLTEISCISFMPQGKDGVFSGTDRCVDPDGGVLASSAAN